VLATLALLPADSGGVVALYTLGAVLLSAAGFGLAAHLIATNILGARSRLFPNWLVVVGLISALAFLISAVLGAVSTDPTANTISLLGFVLWLAWILVVSYRMNDLAPRPQVARQSSTAPEPLDLGQPR
jgi:hypothetical protein